MKAEWTNKDSLTQCETTIAILVIDKPKMCDECKMHFKGIDDNGQFISACCVMSKAYDNGSKVQEWCPLRPIPERKEVHYTDPLFGEVENLTNIGYNKCLDDLEKQNEVHRSD